MWRRWAWRPGLHILPYIATQFDEFSGDPLMGFLFTKCMFSSFLKHHVPEDSRGLEWLFMGLLGLCL